MHEAALNVGILAAAETVAAPFERIKIVMQCQHAMPAPKLLGGSSPSLRHVALQLAREPGLALFRGNGAAVALHAPRAFAVHTRAHDMLFAPFSFPKRGQRVGFLFQWLSSSLSSALLLAFVYPLHYCHVVMAADVLVAPSSRYMLAAQRTYPGYRDCLAAALARRAGGFSIFSGYATAAASVTVFHFVAISLERARGEDGRSLSQGAFLPSIAGQFVAVAAAFPLDTISKWIIVQDAFQRDSRRASPFSLSQDALRNWGFRTFFRGFVAAALRSVVFTALLQAGVVMRS